MDEGEVPGQLDIFGNVVQPRFDGATLAEQPDHVQRLGGQLGRVWDAMADGGWVTLSVLAERAGCTEASASARLRDLRKPRFGAHTIERKRALGAGLYVYRLVVQEQ